MLRTITASVRTFFERLRSSALEIYNETALQHELGYQLRLDLPQGWAVQFERPVATVVRGTGRLTKKEIDLLVTDGARCYAIELKCPRQGRHPETMFDICKDLAFLEELNSVGFCGGLFAVHVQDPLFHSRGATSGIYGYFRAAAPLTGTIAKPTGKTRTTTHLTGTYTITWKECGTNARYWMQEVTKA